MGGLTAPAVFADLPFTLDVLYGELDGTFPNHPADPIQPENLRDLQERVLSVGADVGLAFDGDADRVFLVDDAGALVSGSLTTKAFALAGIKISDLDGDEFNWSIKEFGEEAEVAALIASKEAAMTALFTAAGCSW